MPDKNKYKATLDKIQSIVHQNLKEKGFKKRGRTHNKSLGHGIIQVINFQMGQFPVGENYVIPGTRESYYGRFTVNLGVYIEELDELKGDTPRTFIQEYNCAMRTRLEHLTKNQDNWWTLDDNYERIANEINNGINKEGEAWFELFDNRKKIVRNLLDKSNKSLLKRRAKLDAAIIQLGIDQKDGQRLFKEYYDSIEDKNSHKQYVEQLANRLNVALK